MVIDVHSLNCLRFCHKSRGNFGKTVTLGRQGLHITEAIAGDAINRKIAAEKIASQEYFVDNTLENWFGSSSVDSLDFPTMSKP